MSEFYTKIAAKIISNAEERSLFNGIDDNIREEIGSEWRKIVVDELAPLEAALNAEREKGKALAEALSSIAEGCSFPEDDVQRACRDRARQALAAYRAESGEGV
jgi:hypothetical protein